MSVFKVSDVSVVEPESNLTVDVNNILEISGSTISGRTEATLNFLSWETNCDLVAFVKVEPEAALIAIFTTP